MNKEAYMSSLKTALTGFEEDLVQEIVADYEERFCVGATQGKTEEQIIAELGSVEGLVMELSEMQSFSQGPTVTININKANAEETPESEADGATEQTEDTTQSGNTYNFHGSYTQEKSFTESLDNLMRKVGKVVDEAMREAGHALENAMEQVEIHVEEAKKRRAAGDDVDYNVNINFSSESEKESGKEPNVEQSGKGGANCSKIVVDAAIADVKMRRTSNAIPTADCWYYSHKTAIAYPFYAYQEGDTFYVGIRQESRDKKSGYFQFSWNPSIEIEIGIPEGVQCVTAGSGSGDLSVTELSAKTLKLRSGSGDIAVSYFEGESCCIETSSGDSTLEKSKVQTAELTARSGDCRVFKLDVTKLDADTASGDISACGVVGERVHLRSMSGDQRVDDVEAKELHVNTASGDVDVTDSRGGRVFVAAASGDVSVSGDFTGYQVNSTSGDVEVTSRHDADVTAKSTSGDVEVRVTEAKGHYEVTMNSASGDCNVTGYQDAAGAQPGEKIYRIEGKSISGDVTINFR